MSNHLNLGKKDLKIREYQKQVNTFLLINNQLGCYVKALEKVLMEKHNYTREQLDELATQTENERIKHEETK